MRSTNKGTVYQKEEIKIVQNGSMVLTHYKMSITALKTAKTHQTHQQILLSEKDTLPHHNKINPKKKLNFLTKCV
jgi:hypothetical protein